MNDVIELHQLSGEVIHLRKRVEELQHECNRRLEERREHEQVLNRIARACSKAGCPTGAEMAPFILRLAEEKAPTHAELKRLRDAVVWAEQETLRMIDLAEGTTCEWKDVERVHDRLSDALGLESKQTSDRSEQDGAVAEALRDGRVLAPEPCTASPTGGRCSDRAGTLRVRGVKIIADPNSPRDFDVYLNGADRGPRSEDALRKAVGKLADEWESYSKSPPLPQEFIHDAPETRGRVRAAYKLGAHELRAALAQPTAPSSDWSGERDRGSHWVFETHRVLEEVGVPHCTEDRLYTLSVEQRIRHLAQQRDAAIAERDAAVKRWEMARDTINEAHLALDKWTLRALLPERCRAAAAELATARAECERLSEENTKLEELLHRVEESERRWATKLSRRIELNKQHMREIVDLRAECERMRPVVDTSGTHLDCIRKVTRGELTPLAASVHENAWIKAVDTYRATTPEPAPDTSNASTTPERIRAAVAESAEKRAQAEHRVPMKPAPEPEADDQRGEGEDPNTLHGAAAQLLRATFDAEIAQSTEGYLVPTKEWEHFCNIMKVEADKEAHPEAYAAEAPTPAPDGAKLREAVESHTKLEEAARAAASLMTQLAGLDKMDSRFRVWLRQYSENIRAALAESESGGGK